MKEFPNNLSSTSLLKIQHTRFKVSGHGLCTSSQCTVQPQTELYLCVLLFGHGMVLMDELGNYLIFF